MPKDNADRHGDVERVLCAELRQFHATVRKVHDFLLHPFHLVPEHEGVFPSCDEGESFQRHAAFHLFHCHDCEPLLLQLPHCVGRFLEILPFHAFLGPERRLVDFTVGRGGRYAAEAYLGDAESVARAEHRADVVQAAHVVQHDHHGQFLRLPVFFRAEAVQFFVE